MERKYYDLIVNLIKEHRKFLGNESLLEAIIEEVYSKAGTLLDTVTNEEVIESYLNKLVSTSVVVTVRKNNTNTRNRNVYEAVLTKMSEIEAQTGVLQVEENIISETKEDEEFQDLEEVNSEIQQECASEDVEINSEDFIEEEILEEENELSEKELIEDFIEEASTNDSEIEVVDENVIQEESIDELEPVDKNLVDKMINGVSSIEEESGEFLDFVEESEEISIDDDLFESLEIVEPALLEENEEVFTEDAITEEEVSEEEFVDEEVSLNEVLEEESHANDEILNIEDVEVVEEHQEYQENDLEKTEVLDSLFQEEATIDGDLLENNIDQSIEDLSEPQDNFVIPSYSIFEYYPDVSYNEALNIIDKIQALDTECPDLQILKISELKFYKNKSLAEISDLLELSENEILSVLNKVVTIVKDL